jgi:hypothetical protein
MDDYQVVFLNESFDIKENLKLSKNSFLKQLFVVKFNYLKWNDESFKAINKNLENLRTEINALLQEKLLTDINSVTENNVNLEGKILTLSFENLIEKFLKLNLLDKNNNTIIDDENYSLFRLRMLLFNIIENDIRKDELRPIIILLDLPELYGTPQS